MIASSFAQGHESTGQQIQAATAPSGVQAPKVQRYVQSWLGAVDTDDAWQLEDPIAQTQLTGDISSLPLIGGVGQRMWGQRLQYGFEGGALVGWKTTGLAFLARQVLHG